MTVVRPLQTNFTSGELDPLLGTRDDVKHYYNGAEKLRNVVVIPQGGAFRRPGLLFRREIHPVIAAVATAGATITAPAGGTAGNATDGDVTTLVTSGAASTTNPFVLLHVDFTTATTVLFVDVEALTL